VAERSHRAAQRPHEDAEAQEYIDAMTQTQQLRGKKTAVSTNTIALALAWRRDDAELNGLAQTARNRLFGVRAFCAVRAGAAAPRC
jgi:hypothetical protein